MSVEVDILVSSREWERVDGIEALTQACVARCLEQSGAALAPGCEISVNFCDDATIRALNAKWRGKDAPTNVLSFPTPGALAARPLLGDVVIAYETVAREAREQDKPLRNHAAHMVIHGFLHVIGYDHETPADADAMEALERRVAAALGMPDPFADAAPGDGAEKKPVERSAGQLKEAQGN